MYDGIHLEFLPSQTNVNALLTTQEPARAMLPAAVQVQTASGMMVNEQPPIAVALQPTGTVHEVIAFVPVT